MDKFTADTFNTPLPTMPRETPNRVETVRRPAARVLPANFYVTTDGRRSARWSFTLGVSPIEGARAYFAEVNRVSVLDTYAEAYYARDDVFVRVLHYDRRAGVLCDHPMSGRCFLPLSDFRASPPTR